ncbi:hypothetical protein [Halomonas sp. HL-93]|uniref:hypothetical protein n=1 Tax=Halomonas sp. HL-93 TaxID=1666906 RepID=UPI0007F05CC9|nr:hypothetical protein [Halomonas sp. HL-93]SBR45144.1 hypothetical protein GA0071314_0093 [Halomonas sp. HL-93]
MFSKKDQVVHSKCAVINFVCEKIDLDSDDFSELLSLINKLRDDSLEYGSQNNNRG